MNQISARDTRQNWLFSVAMSRKMTRVFARLRLLGSSTTVWERGASLMMEVEPLKALVLGGYGRVGLAAGRFLAQSDLFSEICLAGRNLSRADSAASVIGDKAIPLQVDATDEQILCSVSTGYDVVVNAAAGSTVLPALRAAIRNRIHYCDVQGSRGNLNQALLLSPAACDAGITACDWQRSDPGPQ
jgi:saccharopine dehydrogenase-like NADP-dependent oxidoreductase